MLCIGNFAFAQVNGNKNIITRTFPLEDIQKIKINFYAKITIDQSAKTESMTITTDENVMDLIGKEVVDNTLYLDQIKWIEPSKSIITIGAPNIRHVETGTHDVTKIINVDNDYLQLTSPIGTIIIEGKTKEFRLGVEIAKVDASKLIAENAFVNIWSRGNAKVNVTNTLNAEVKKSGKLIYVNTPKKIKKKTRQDGRIISATASHKIKNPNAEWISFKIKNNNFKAWKIEGRQWQYTQSFRKIYGSHKVKFKRKKDEIPLWFTRDSSGEHLFYIYQKTKNRAFGFKKVLK